MNGCREASPFYWCGACAVEQIADDGNTINGHWDRLDEHENWQPWMDITLTRQPWKPVHDEPRD